MLRSLILILLGIFLRSQGRPQTYFTFEDVLTQIGLGYPFLFLLAWTRPRWQAVAAVAILVGYWAAFALYPLPPPGFDWTSVGVPAGLAAPPVRVRRALGQEHQPRPARPTCGSSTCSRASRRSASTAAAISR